MKKKYTLDFSIERDCDRLRAVQDILDSLDTDPSASELEQMASYILYGKDENGQNAIQRNETTNRNKRYKSYKTKDDKVKSLDEIMEMPGFDEQQLRSAYVRDAYTVPKPTILKPKYDKVTGEMIDPGDSDIPGMREQWEIIDRWQRMLDIAQGKIPPDSGDVIVSDPYRIYQLKHNLIDIRKHQYYLKDAYKPLLHFQNLDHPKPQFYDWSGDSFYWTSRENWQHKVDTAYTSRVSKDINDYETRGEGDTLEVKWMVCHHTFNWEDPKHIRAFINNYAPLKEQLHDKLDSYGRTLFWDFERYIELCNFPPIRIAILNLKLQQYTINEIAAELETKFQTVYNVNHLAAILSSEIPKKIALIAIKQRLICETPNNRKQICVVCHRLLPLSTYFFTKNNARSSTFSSTCKECDRRRRIEKMGGNVDDRRSKNKEMFKVQARQTH